MLLLNPPGTRAYQRDTFCASVSKGGYALPPGDLLLISGSFDQRVDLRVLDCLAQGVCADALLAAVRPHDWDAIVVQTCSVSWQEDAATLRALARAGTRVRIAVNGDHALGHPRSVLADPELGVEAVVTDMLQGGVSDWALTGRGAGVMTAAGPGPVARGAALAPRHDLFPLRRYAVPWAVRRPVTTVYGSLGCPLTCQFCFAGTFKWRARPVPEVLDELAFARRAGAREVVFFDSMFNGSQPRAADLCEGLTRRGLDLSWSCFSHVRFVRDPAALRSWRRAGCHTVLLGLESANPASLAAMDKRQTPDEMREAVSRLTEAGLRVGAFFLLGYPGETDEDMRRTIALATELDLSFASFQFAVPFDTTPMGKQVLEAAGREGPLLGFDDATRPFSADPARPVERLRALAAEANRSFYTRPDYIARRLADVRSATELSHLVREGARLVAGGLGPEGLKGLRAAVWGRRRP